MKEKNVLLFKFRCNMFIGVRIIKEMPGSVASGTPCRIVILKNTVINNYKYLVRCKKKFETKKAVLIMENFAN